MKKIKLTSFETPRGEAITLAYSPSWWPF